jgi:membrane-bound serine protease (ClpP class)
MAAGLIFAALAMGAGAQTTSPTTSTGIQPAVTPPTSRLAVVVVLKGEIDEFNKDSMIKRFDEARKLGADTIILQINTYGGLVTSGLDISGFLKRQNDLRVIAFVDEKAISAGAMIALACNEIVMEPVAKLGDCAPIMMSSSGSGLETMGAAERAKMESPILEDFYDSAVRNGYDPLLVQSMVSVGRVVHWVQGPGGERRFVDEPTYQSLTKEGWKPVAGEPDPIDSGDTLLTVNSDRAVRLGLAKAIEHSPQSLAASRGFSIQATLAPSSGEAIIGFLSSAAVRGILTTVFLLSLYLCFSHPGHGMAEVVAVVSLGVLIGVPLLTGYAQWWEILAILIGLVLISLEIFVIPGFGVAGIAGIVLLLAGLTMTFVGDEPIGIPGVLPKLQGTWDNLLHALYIVVGGMACSLLLWFWIQRYLPKLPYLNRLILATSTNAHQPVTSEAIQDVVQTAVWPPLGSKGKAVTDLRPGGSAAFFDDAIADARIIDVISDIGFIREGTEVIVREAGRARIVVRAAAAAS